MKMVDEIKKGLECCLGQYSASCGKCPYSNDGKDCGRNGVQIMKDALVYIQTLESIYSQVKAKPKRLTQNHIEDMKIICKLERERDAAVADLDKNHQCDICAHVDCQWDEYPCSSCLHSDPVDNVSSNFAWRGVCPENTEVQDDD